VSGGGGFSGGADAGAGSGWRGRTVGLIAGNLSLPLRAARSVAARGGRLVVVGIRGETDPEVYKLADSHLEIVLGRLGAMADFFAAERADSVCLVGGVGRDNVVGAYEPDEAAVSVMERLPNFQTNTILRGLADYLESRGPRVVSVAELLPELLVRPGLLTSTPIKPDLLADLRLAFSLARELGRLDCGQTAVVSDLVAVALEGADGTDATVRRGSLLSKKRVAVAKTVKPGQDRRLDLPVVGPRTIEVLAECRAGALALDASGLIMLDPEECLAMAEAAGLAVVAWESADWDGNLGRDAVTGFWKDRVGAGGKDGKDGKDGKKTDGRDGDDSGSGDAKNDEKNK
jgi:DUF1009 family protein